MSANLGTTQYTSVTWTSGDVLTEAKLDNMVANDQAYDSHAAQGLLLNNNKSFALKKSGGSNINLLKLDTSDNIILGETDLSEFNFFELASDPSNAPSGMRRVFAKSDGMYERDDAGNQRKLGAPTVLLDSRGSSTTPRTISSATSYQDVGGMFSPSAIDTKGGDLLIIVEVPVTPNVGSYPEQYWLGINIDGSRTSPVDMEYLGQVVNNHNHWSNCRFTFWLTGLSAGNHTFKIQVQSNKTSLQVSDVTTSQGLKGVFKIIEF